MANATRAADPARARAARSGGRARRGPVRHMALGTRRLPLRADRGRGGALSRVRYPIFPRHMAWRYRPHRGTQRPRRSHVTGERPLAAGTTPATPPAPPARCGVTLERHRPVPSGPRSTCSTVFQLAPPSTAPKEAPPPARADATSTEVGGTRNRRPKRGNRGTAAGAGETREPRVRVFHARPSHGGSKGTPWAGRPRGGRSRVPVSPALPERGSATGRSVWRWVVAMSIRTSNAWWLFFR